MAAGCGLAAASTTKPGCGAAAAVPPSRDPWYSLPKGADCDAPSSPGRVLRVRRAPKAARESLRGIEDAWNVLFCSTDSLGAPTFSVTTVIVPRDADPNVLVTFPPAYDSANVDDSPSYALSRVEAAGIDQAVFTPLLVSKRWVVNMPDYEGPRAAYLAGRNTGHAVLDSIRAVRSLAEGGGRFGLATGYRQAIHGYSGGAVAGQWAAQLQPEYAPELAIDAVAYGGLPVNVTGSVGTVNGGAGAGFIVLIFLGATVQYPEARRILVDNLRKTGPYNATTFLNGSDQPASEALATFANQDIAEYFVNGFDFLHDPDFARIFQGDTVAGLGATPTIPLYVFHAVRDELSPIEEMDGLVDKYCADGASISYRRNRVGDHTANGIAGGIAALNWLSGLFSGAQKPIQGCATTNVSEPLGLKSLALVFIVLGKQGYDIPYFLRAQQLTGVPALPADATNQDVFRALQLTSRDILKAIGLDDQALAEFHVSTEDLEELGIK